MQTDVVLIDGNTTDEAFQLPVCFSVVSNGLTLARIETSISAEEQEGSTFEAAARNRIHEITEILDDWIRQNRPIARG